MSNKRRYALVFGIIAPFLLLYALIFPYRNTRSICRACGRFRAQKSMLGITYEDKAEPKFDFQIIAKLHGGECAHKWEVVHCVSHDVLGMHFCAVGAGLRTQRVFVKLSMAIECKAFSDSEGKTLLQRIQDADLENFKQIETEIDNALEAKK